MIEISKELLSEVLGAEIVDILPDRKIIGSEKNLEYVTKNSFRPYDYINIYELAHKCKEWAWNNFGLNIFIEKHTFDLYEASIKICRFNNKFGSYNSFCSYYPKENTEVEAIIKACTYILNNLSNK